MVRLFSISIASPREDDQNEAQVCTSYWAAMCCVCKLLRLLVTLAVVAAEGRPCQPYPKSWELDEHPTTCERNSSREAKSPSIHISH